MEELKLFKEFSDILTGKYEERYERDTAVFAFVKKHDLHPKPLFKISNVDKERIRRYGKTDMLFDSLFRAPYYNAILEEIKKRESVQK